MSIEVIYKRMYGYRIKIAEYIAVYFISLVMNYLSDPEVLNGSQTMIPQIMSSNRI
jgi:hypothetical protein